MIESLSTPSEIIRDLAFLLREKRLLANMTQEHLASQANVSISVLRQFERTAKISLESFIRLAFVLGLTDSMLETLRTPPKIILSLDALLKQDLRPKRKRASRQKREKHD